jgi:N-acetylmuramoyl-L-alanine amidase
MKRYLGLTILASILMIVCHSHIPVAASDQSLFLAYPPNNHQTTASRIFLIGTASPDRDVLVNSRPIQRSKAGHFAPNFPLQMGDNLFTVGDGNQEFEIKVTRIPNEPEIPREVAFAQNSLMPIQDIARLPGESICFGAIAPPRATVLVKLADRTVPLLPQATVIKLPPNSAILNSENQPTSSPASGRYQGCMTVSAIGNLGHPLFQLSLEGKTITQEGSGTVEIISPQTLRVVEVTVPEGVTRTGPGSDYSRLTPLPQGARASVTGKEGTWLRLDYGAWINNQETKAIPATIPPQSLIRSINSQKGEGATEVVFPLQTPVPVAVQQGDDNFTLTLYNTIAQTDTIRLDDDPVIRRLDWQQVTPTTVQYTFYLKSKQQWGYRLRYEGSSLILWLRHPPQLESSDRQSLKGIKILLDPGHGGEETGTKGPNGYPEKDVNLTVTKLLQQELLKQGATVDMTRESDRDLSLQERVDRINVVQPTIALSIHFNALPDGGDAMGTSGVSAFWYHPQAHNLSIFLHNYLVTTLHRPSYGVFWNNLALTRPAIAPAVLLELGFMINPDEFEWIMNPQSQETLAKTLANGIREWFLREVDRQ